MGSQMMQCKALETLIASKFDDWKFGTTEHGAYRPGPIRDSHKLRTALLCIRGQNPFVYFVICWLSYFFCFGTSS